MVGMIIPMFVWQSPKGHRYGNQLYLEDGRRHHQERPILLASAFDNGLADCKSAFKRLNGNIRATSYPYLVNFCPIIFWCRCVLTVLDKVRLARLLLLL